MAKGDLIRATQLSNRRQPDEFLELADLYMEEGDFTNALATYQASEEVKPTKHSATRQMEALIELSRYEDALEKCDSTLPSDDPYARSFRGWIYMLQHDYEKALSELIRSTNEMGDDYGAYAYYGLAWLTSTCPMDSVRDAERAQFNLDKAEGVGVLASWEIRRVEALIAANCGEWERAEQLQRQVVSECASWASEAQNAVLELIHTRTPVRSVNRATRIFPS